MQENDLGMDQELLKFRAIIGHQAPLKATDPDWKGSMYNVQVECETRADDPVTCAAYAKQHGIVALEGWSDSRILPRKISF